MRFCEECGSLMHTAGDIWVCRSCEREEPRDSKSDEAMSTQAVQQDEGSPDVADATTDSIETVEAACPAEDCESSEAYTEMMPKPGGSYEVRLFTCLECGHKWRET